MSTVIQRRRGTTAEHATFTGAEGELTIDTDKNTAVVHDGATVGGFPLAKESDIANMLEASDIGVTVQGYDVDTAKLDVDQTFTGAQRGSVTTDNDLSFDLGVTNNFSCTPTGTGTLTFTNIASAAGQSGLILLNNSGAHAISAAATTKVSATFLAAVSVAGVYLLTYFSNGTNVYVVASEALA